MGAQLRLVSSGDLVYNTAALNFRGLGQDLHSFELSWLGFGHYQRPNSSSNRTQTMGIGSNGAWAFYVGSGNASDASLKSATEDASTEDCLQMLRQVSARTYERTDLPGMGSRIGFIAQEVRDAAPAAFGGLIGAAPSGRRHNSARSSPSIMEGCRLCIGRARAPS